MLTLKTLIPFYACILSIRALITNTTSNFLLGTWQTYGSIYSLNYYNCPKTSNGICLYCCPQDTVSLTQDPNNSSQMIMTATSWSGNCSLLGIDVANFQLEVPYDGDNTSMQDLYNQFSPDQYNPKPDCTEATWNTNGLSDQVGFNPQPFGTLPDGSQNVSVCFTVSYPDPLPTYGCAVNMIKTGSLKAHGLDMNLAMALIGECYFCLYDLIKVYTIHTVSSNVKKCFKIG